MTTKFFNMIPGGDTACILLYGDISDYGDSNAKDIVKELMDIQNQYKKIDIRINSNGGDVYGGIAIINALRQCTAEVTVYVDGIAASMAAVIALCGRKLQMSRYARLMLHDVKGGAYGNKADLQLMIDQIISLENSLCDLIAAKMGKTPEEIKTAYFDGKDHWITAGEALALGLIDGIYDVEPLPEESTTEQIYKIFNNRLSNRTLKTKSMNIDEIKKRPSFTDAATDADVLRIIDRLETEAAKVPGINTDMERLSGELKVFRDKADAEETAAKKKMLDDAEADGRINAVTRAVYQAFLDKDRENGEAALKALPVKKRIVNYLEKPDENKPGAWEARMKEIDEKNKNKN
jgi:ATP-dependent Clp endopeptidase proteolytic subunit ClpP